MPRSNTFTLICNPEILSQEDEFVMTGEGCLSFPKKHKDTVRYRTVKVKYRDENFEERTVVAEGIEAVVFQHEIGHLNGELFFDRVAKPYRATPVQGRNEKCACGSGKKFKKCHGGV
jgi:peptide deformylase